MVRPNKIIAPSLSFVIAVYTKFKKYLSINVAHSKSIGTFLITLFPVVGVKAKLFHPQSTSNYHTSGLEYSIFFSYVQCIYIKIIEFSPCHLLLVSQDKNNVYSFLGEPAGI